MADHDDKPIKTKEDHNESPLLSLGLSDQVMAQKIMTCLHRNCVLRAMQVRALKRHFRLADFYCAQHGTKLKAPGEDDDKAECSEPKAQKTGDKTKGKKEKDSANSISSRKEAAASPKKKTHCEDCERAKDGYRRCPQCEKFEEEQNVMTCHACGKTNCTQCWDVEAGKCGCCEKYFCGERGCSAHSILISCDRCGEMYCESCDPFVACKACNTIIACHEDCASFELEWGGGNIFRCKECKEFFHNECRRYITCGDCREKVCAGCKTMFFFCDGCRRYFCKSCKKHKFCGECDIQSCDACHFVYQCEDCNIRFCVFCPPSVGFKAMFFCDGCGQYFCKSCEEQKCCSECGIPSCDACCYQCTDCNSSFCVFCPPERAFYCSWCKEPHCRACIKYEDCPECAEQLCKDSMSECTKCKRATCPYCTYGCVECDQKNCGDCCLWGFRTCDCQQEKRSSERLRSEDTH